MKSNKRICVIVPVFNEGKVIRNTLSELLSTPYELIVVDDASKDDTYLKIKDLAIHYLRHEINLGQGAALQTGMGYAVLLNADVVIHFDADGQHRIADLPSLLEPILEGKADVVLGSRFMNGTPGEIPLVRKVLLQHARWINGLLTGLWLSDAHNGLRALNRTAFSKIQLKENGMAHATEILIEVRKHKLKFMEIPVEILYSTYSQSKGQSAWNAFNILSDILLRKFFP